MPAPTKVKVNLRVDSRHTTHLNIGDDVEFVSAQDCTLSFTDSAVFGTSEVNLTANDPVVLTVGAEGATQFTALAPQSKAPPILQSRTSPNDIIVP